MSDHYYDWPKIDGDRARRALAKGGRLFDLPTSFGNACAVYRTGLETKRGACYLVSDFIKRGLVKAPAN
jgi:hypothetical protein